MLAAPRQLTMEPRTRAHAPCRPPRARTRGLKVLNVSELAAAKQRREREQGVAHASSCSAAPAHNGPARSRARTMCTRSSADAGVARSNVIRYSKAVLRRKPPPSALDARWRVLQRGRSQWGGTAQRTLFHVSLAGAPLAPKPGRAVVVSGNKSCAHRSRACHTCAVMTTRA